MSNNDKSQKAELIFESEHHRNEIRKHFEWLLKKYTAADFRNTNTEAGCIWNDAVNLARGIQAEQSAMTARDKVLEEAMAVMALEHLEDPQNDEDRAYDLGVTDAYCAVKRMLSQYVLDKGSGP